MKRLIPILILFLIFPAACGKKGPPVPLRKTPPPAVEEVAAERQGDRVWISWSLGDEARRMKVAAFRIFRHEEPDDGEPCDTCPLRFVQVAEVSPGAGPSPRGRHTFVDAVRPDYRYAYKIQTVEKSGLTSPDSKVVWVRSAR